MQRSELIGSSLLLLILCSTTKLLLMNCCFSVTIMRYACWQFMNVFILCMSTERYV